MPAVGVPGCAQDTVWDRKRSGPRAVRVPRRNSLPLSGFPDSGLETVRETGDLKSQTGDWPLRWAVTFFGAALTIRDLLYEGAIFQRQQTVGPSTSP